MPKGDTLLKIAKHFGVSTDYLLTGQEPTAPTITPRTNRIVVMDYHGDEPQSMTISDEDAEFLRSAIELLKQRKK